MSRSSWKIPYIIQNLEKNTRINRIMIYKRAATITPRYISKTVYIFNGLRSVPIRITEQHIGFKFGAFVLTKKRVKHTSSKKKTKK